MIGHLGKLQPDNLQLKPIVYEGCFGSIGREKELTARCLSISFQVGVITKHCMMGRMSWKAV